MNFTGDNIAGSICIILFMLTKQFNEKSLTNQQQLEIFPHHFSDVNRLIKLVQTFLHDLEKKPLGCAQSHTYLI